MCVGWGGGVRGQLPAGGIRASQGTFSSLPEYSHLIFCLKIFITQTEFSY